MLSHQQEMRKMLDNGTPVDEISRTVWPAPWELRQRQLVRVVWKRPQEEFTPYDDFMALPGAVEPSPSMIVLRPDKVRMVRVSQAATWTRDVEIVQEASMERAVTSETDAVTQACMADRMTGLGEQMLGHDVYGAQSSRCGSSSSAATATIAHAQGNIAPVAKAHAPAAAAPPAQKVTPTKAAKKEADDDDDAFGAFNIFGSLVDRQPDVSPPVKVDAKVEEQAAEVAHTPIKVKGQKVVKKEAAAAKAKAGSKKGRPAEGGYLKLKGGLKNLAESTEDTAATWFSSIWTTATSRNWNNWRLAIAHELESCDPSMLEELNQIDRSSKVCTKVLNGYQKFGAGSMQTYQLYLTEMRWLRLGPASNSSIPNPFPLFCREAMFGLNELHAAPAHFWTQLQSAYMSSQDLPLDTHERLRTKVLNDKFSCILEGDAVADAEDPLVELLSSLKTAKVDSSVDHILPDMKHVTVIVAEQFPEAALHDADEDEAQRLKNIGAALSSQSGLLNDLRVSSLFRMMERRALKAKTFLIDRQTKVAVVQAHVSTGVIASKDVVIEMEASK